MTINSTKKSLRSVLIELGAVVPVTDEEVTQFERANQAAIEMANKELTGDYLDAVIVRGYELQDAGDAIITMGNSVSDDMDVRMAAREGKDLPLHIREKMAEAKKRVEEEEKP